MTPFFQVPQMLADAAFLNHGAVCVTQPRRVAAVPFPALFRSVPKPQLIAVYHQRLIILSLFATTLGVAPTFTRHGPNMSPTCPRQVSVARRVAKERGGRVGDEVSQLG